MILRRISHFLISLLMGAKSLAWYNNSWRNLLFHPFSHKYRKNGTAHFHSKVQPSGLFLSFQGALFDQGNFHAVHLDHLYSGPVQGHFLPWFLSFQGAQHWARVFCFYLSNLILVTWLNWKFSNVKFRKNLISFLDPQLSLLGQPLSHHPWCVACWEDIMIIPFDLWIHTVPGFLLVQSYSTVLLRWMNEYCINSK